jgi:hypothetical protein
VQILVALGAERDQEEKLFVAKPELRAWPSRRIRRAVMHLSCLTNSATLADAMSAPEHHAALLRPGRRLQIGLIALPPGYDFALRMSHGGTVR